MMRSAPLARRCPLLRKTFLRRSRAAGPRRAGVRDPVYRAYVRRLPCVAKMFPGHVCFGRRHAHHATYGRGLGQKSDDHETMCLCALAHEQFHAGAGPFRGMDKIERRDWQKRRVVETRTAIWALRAPQSDMARLAA
jgi:hypothetical protein